MVEGLPEGKLKVEDKSDLPDKCTPPFKANVYLQTTNLAISVVTLLMVLVLQNTQNRHSAALHLKLDEVVRAEPEARDEIRGVESRPEREIRELTREETDDLVPSGGHESGGPSPAKD